MKIALLSPAGAMHRYNGSFGKGIHYAPVTMPLLAALVPEELNAEVKIYDETVAPIPLDIDADIIGITAITGTAPRSYKFADYYRKKGAKVVIGGAHVSLLPKEAMEHADAIARGVADRTWVELLRDFSQGKMKREYLPESIILTGRPHPKRELYSKRDFISINSIEATKGCTNECTFCAVNALYKQKVYKREIREIIKELEEMEGRDVIFVDPNLVADKEFAKELFTAMIPLKKLWFGLSTADIVYEDELIEIMRKSGCRGLLIGFESVTDSSLQDINKGHNKGVDYKLLMKKMHDNGIAVNGTFCFGTDEDDSSVFARTVEKIIEWKVDLPRFSVLTPFPGTPLYDKLESEGRIFERDWAMYDVEHCVYQPKKMTPQQLEEGLAWAWDEVYKYSSIFKRVTWPHKLFPVNLYSNITYRTYATKLRGFTREVMVDNSDIPE